MASGTSRVHSDCHGDSGNNDPATEWDNVVVSALKPMAEQTLPITPPAGLLDRLRQIIAEHLVIEATFRCSALEAGGGSADTDNLEQGDVRFRSKQGRLDVEQLLQELVAGRLPVSLEN